MDRQPVGHSRYDQTASRELSRPLRRPYPVPDVPSPPESEFSEEPPRNRRQTPGALFPSRRTFGGPLGTALSLAGAAIVVTVAIVKAGIDPGTLWQRLSGISVGLLVCSFLAYYLTFPLRGYRWKVLIRNTCAGTHATEVRDAPVGELTEIVYLSYFVNAVVPAKLGDAYRAYLAKLWIRLPWAAAMGTVVSERIVDIAVVGVLLPVTAIVVFQDHLGQVSLLLAVALGLSTACIAALIVVKPAGRLLHVLAPARLATMFESFQGGLLQSLNRLPPILILTLFIWLLEGVRLLFVFASLGITFQLSGASITSFLFLALGTAILVTLPFTPGGLGLAEVGLGTLIVYLGFSSTDAAAVVVVDRLVSYYSIVILGLAVYLFGRRSHLRHGRQSVLDGYIAAGK